MAINSRAGNGATPRETALELGEEIVAVRQDLDMLLAEADRRRHEVMDVRLQLRRHAATALFTGMAILGGAAAMVRLGVRRRRQRQRLSRRAGRLGQAVSRMMDQPHRVAAEPTFLGRIVTAIVISAAASLANSLVKTAVEQLFENRPRLNGVTEPRRGLDRASQRSESSWRRQANPDETVPPVSRQPPLMMMSGKPVGYQRCRTLGSSNAGEVRQLEI
jgi:hypothetical protein